MHPSPSIQSAYERSRQPSSRPPSNEMSKQICFDANNNNTIKYENKEEEKMVVGTRARANSASCSVCMANGTCHMLICILAFASVGANCLFYRSASIRCVDFYLLLASAERANAGARVRITTEQWTNYGHFERAAHCTKANCNRFQCSWLCRLEIVRENRTRLLRLFRLVSVALCTAAPGSLNWTWNPNYFIFYLTALRELALSILTVCHSHSFSRFFVSVDLSTPRFRSFYLREDDFCQSKLTRFLFSFLFPSRIIVGAPLADTSRIQAGVLRGGAVYRCDIAEDNRCRIIPFDSEGKQIVCHLSPPPPPPFVPLTKSNEDTEETQVRIYASSKRR